MNIIAANGYTFKFAARGEKFAGKLAIRILSSTGAILASGDISGFGKGW